MRESEALERRAARVLAPCAYGSPFGRVQNPIMPTGTPSFFARARGARLWDVDGREYIDYICALGPNLLGYGDERVEAAAQRQRSLGDTMSGAAPVMVELAERLVGMISHADWALFAKNGVDVISGALRIARAHTGKRRVLVARHAYHGAHSWCVPVPTGTLPEQRAHRTEYVYNDIDSLEAAASDAGTDLAAIFATAYKHDLFVDQEPLRREYAQRCREICDRTGALLVIDDIRAGFRLTRECSWSLVGVQPDLSCWSKAIGNGYAISALLGSEKCRNGASGVYVSGTFWVQAVPMAAACATLEIIRTTDYLEHMVKLGERLRAGLNERARAHDFRLRQTGPVQMPMILFEDDPDFRFVMAFGRAMMDRGIYMLPYHNLFICAAMTEQDIDLTLEVADASFAEIADRRGAVQPHPGLQKLFGSSKA